MSRTALSARRVGIAVVTCLAVVGNPAWATSLGVDVWNLPGLQDEVDAAVAQSRTVEEADGIVLRRMELKERLVDDLIDGRTTLAEVTAQFLALNQHRSTCMSVIRANCPGRTDAERIARNILQYASLRLPEYPPNARQEIIERLDTELAHFLVEVSAAAE